ncbi:hypothetical protein AA11825_2054 [Acetobacter pomorum DSM 11825]|nr:hypothetical protein AA11825_2054 [Acetobacter pomorum DSM 11825]
MLLIQCQQYNLSFHQEYETQHLGSEMIYRREDLELVCGTERYHSELTQEKGLIGLILYRLAAV